MKELSYEEKKLILNLIGEEWIITRLTPDESHILIFMCPKGLPQNKVNFYIV